MPREPEVLPHIIHYPSSDGKPMADNTRQYEAIVLLHDNIAAMFGEEDQVAVLADNLWYPVEGHPEVCTAPDVMVIFGRPRGHRRSYLQWKEGGIAPQVVFEVLSHNNTLRELLDKHTFYEKFGVEEYYLYDPGDDAWEKPKLEGWLRADGRFRPVAMDGHVSPRLGIRFDMSRGSLDVYSPKGERFIPFLEALRRKRIAEQHADEVEHLADLAREQAAQAQQLTAHAQELTEQARKERDLQFERAERMAARLRELGIDPDAA